MATAKRHLPYVLFVHRLKSHTFSWNRVSFSWAHCHRSCLGKVRSCSPNPNLHVAVALVHVVLHVPKIKDRCCGKSVDQIYYLRLDWLIDAKIPQTTWPDSMGLLDRSRICKSVFGTGGKVKPVKNSVRATAVTIIFSCVCLGFNFCLNANERRFRKDTATVKFMNITVSVEVFKWTVSVWVSFH